MRSVDRGFEIQDPDPKLNYATFIKERTVYRSQRSKDAAADT